MPWNNGGQGENPNPWGSHGGGNQGKPNGEHGPQRPGGPFGGQQPPDLDKMISQAQQFIRNLLGGGSNGGGRPPSGDGEGFGGFLLSGRGLSLLGLLVAVVWMASGIYRRPPMPI